MKEVFYKPVSGIYGGESYIAVVAPDYLQAVRFMDENFNGNEYNACLRSGVYIYDKCHYVYFDKNTRQRRYCFKTIINYTDPVSTSNS